MLVKVLLLLLGFNAVTSRHVNFYRKDYVYVEEFDAFYKLHSDIGKWSSAFLACDNEEAELFYPQAGEEWTVVKKLANTVSAVNETDIFVGIHNLYGLGEMLTVDGRTTPSAIVDAEENNRLDRCVTMNVETGVMTAMNCDPSPENWRPFVCKKVEDVSCPTIDKGYKYSKVTKKCYKRNDNPKTWSQAMETCYLEGGILVVVTSNVEAEVIARDVIEGDRRCSKYHAGFRKTISSNQFYTVRGHKLQDSGFDIWNNRDDKQYACGAIFNNPLYLTSLDCDNTLPFVCEMEVRKSPNL